MMSNKIDVIIIGGGPSGLSAGVELKRAGVARVVVLEREPQAGGIPRHCGHPPFGMREFKWIYTGPQYARKLVKTAVEAGVEIRTLTSVVEALPGGKLLVTSDNGVEKISAQRVIYATGVRETPRSARIISGSRPLGVLNTGALQSMVYLKHRRPFKRPVIVGTELVSFSAIQTCRHMGIRPVAMIEQAARVTARWPVGLFPMLMRVPLHLNTRLVSIKGDKRVEAVEVENASRERRVIECDGVLLTGQFTPEATLARCGHLEIDAPSVGGSIRGSGGPVVDQYGRCSDPAYFAAGNLLRPVETAGWSWNEGRQVGRWVADDLAGDLAGDPLVTGENIHITIADPIIKFAMPQKISLPYKPERGMKHVQLRFTDSVKGTLVAEDGQGKVMWQCSLNTHRERRVLVPVAGLVSERSGGEIVFRVV